MPKGVYKRTEFHLSRLKGRRVWNKGTKGLCKPNSGSFKKGIRNAGVKSILEGLPNYSLNTELYKKEYCRKRLIYYKKIVFDHYGHECVCCGEQTPQFLTIDHVNNDGNKDKIGKKRLSGLQLYVKIIREGLGSRYQVLCMNCNYGKYINKGVCPHQII